MAWTLTGAGTKMKGSEQSHTWCTVVLLPEVKVSQVWVGETTLDV